MDGVTDDAQSANAALVDCARGLRSLAGFSDRVTIFSQSFSALSLLQSVCDLSGDGGLSCRSREACDTTDVS
jgi:hypothetical protein